MARTARLQVTHLPRGLPGNAFHHQNTYLMTDTTEQRSQLASQRLVIEAGRAEAQYWRDLSAYRELFAVLAWRDVAVRYKQTVIGIAWALIQPLLKWPPASPRDNAS